MYFYLVLLVTILFNNESTYALQGIFGNPNIPLVDDCALRSFLIEMAAYIAPNSSKNSWTTLSQSAFQMNQCNGTNQLQTSSKTFKTATEMPRGVCQHSIFVHDEKGNDLFYGTFEKPMKTISAALSLARSLRAIHTNDDPLCITIRGGIYYLGANSTTSSSQIGAIALTSNDSNLIIENYQDEKVILSGGALLQLQWSVYTKTDVGTIYKSQIPDWINMESFNELYIDGKRAIVAKYPNGDPATQGLYANNSGFSNAAQSWIKPIEIPSMKILVQEPSRSRTIFSNYQDGFGGGASAFNPPRNFWSATTSYGRDLKYAVPRGLTLKPGAFPHLSNWSKPNTGFVHVLQGADWGSWVFQINTTISAENTILFGRGGFQEARGWDSGGEFYVANIFEELDSPNEWFLDKETRTLYFMPNETMPDTFVASQIPCIISVSGSAMENSVRNVLIRNLTLTQTTNTYMRDYMVPSGGDWSIHRGGTIYLTNTRNITISQNIFTQLGSNGIAMIDYNDRTVISLNEFSWSGDSGIILVGSTNGIDGFTIANQPTNTLIQSNLFHETGIYIKQSSPVFITLSRSISVVGNLMFNMPRAAININDGFYGNHTISYNVIFNTVRETGDHGPINTWDRQPYITDAMQSGVPSLRQHQSYIHHNVIFNNYRSVWPIDHDDGSCYYEDSYNFLVYGGKKNYLGYSKIDHHEIYVYSDGNPGGPNNKICIYDDAADISTSAWNETWVENICILYNSSVPYVIIGCDTAHKNVPYLANNTIYIPAGTEPVFTCEVNGKSMRMNLQQWQSYGFDIGTTIETTPDVQTIIQWGREMLQNTL